MTQAEFFERPILNAPYVEPSRHWELDAEDRPTQRVVERRRFSRLATALPGASAGPSRGSTGSPFEG